VTLSNSPPHVDAALRALLSEAIDYAGLFPPAQLDMPGAVAEYAAYLGSQDVWALGRFVVPASRLDELAEVAAHDAAESARSLGVRPAPWRLSVLLGADITADAERTLRFHSASGSANDGWSARVEAIEVRASSPDAIAAAVRAVPEGFERYVEIPIDGDPTTLVRAIGDGSAFAKVRTGGTTADAFPASDDLVRFLATCVRERVPFKATAGLHHPLRGEYPLTYEPNATAGRMYGFLNVFLASAFLKSGMPEADARQLLEEQEAASIRFDQSGVAWRGHRLSTEQLLAARRMVKSFWSCSVREAIDDLGEIGLL
jgi:hypothetical protein